MNEFPPPVHRVRVRYCETDRMAVAHHGSYVAWFEEARTEWMRARGRTYRQLEDEGNLLQVVEFVCRYHKPVDYDEVVSISIRVAEVGKVAVNLEYECRRTSDGAVCATGNTRLACVGRDGKLRRLPPELSHCSTDTEREPVIERNSTSGDKRQLKVLVMPSVKSMLGCCGTPTSATVIRVLPLTTTNGDSGFTVPVKVV